jgi:hypothetical protein
VVFFDLIVRWFVYLIAIVAAVNTPNLAFLTALISQIIAFQPNIAIFILLPVVGVIAIDWFADFLRYLGATQRIAFMGPLTAFIQAFLYFVLVVLALQQLKIDLTIIYIFITPIAWEVGLGLCAAIAIIVGFGLKDRAPRMMDDLTGTIREQTASADLPKRDGPGSL